MPVCDTFFDPKTPQKKFPWVPFLCSFPENEAREPFSGARMGSWRGVQKVYVENKLRASSVPYMRFLFFRLLNNVCDRFSVPVCVCVPPRVAISVGLFR